MAQVQDQEGGSVPACIYSEEDLQRAIELGAWYDSEEDETCSDDEDTDSGADQYGYLNQVTDESPCIKLSSDLFVSIGRQPAIAVAI